MEGVEFVKKNYKGNFESLKWHKDVSNYIEWNKMIEFDEKERPEDAILAPMITPRLSTKLKYLRVDRLEGSSFRLGMKH